LFCVLLHFMVFLCIFQNKPTNETPQCKFPVFCYFCVSQNLHRKYSRNWTKQKPNLLFFQNTSRSPKQRWTGARTWPNPRAARPSPGPCHQGVSPPGPLPDAALPPIYSTRWEKLKTRSLFHETYCKPPPSLMRGREGPDSLPGTLRERGITAEGLLHHHGRLRSDV
jgi:hypothetical protein